MHTILAILFRGLKLLKKAMTLDVKSRGLECCFLQCIICGIKDIIQVRATLFSIRMRFTRTINLENRIKFFMNN